MSSIYWEIKSSKELDELKNLAELCVLDFHAKWCGPCKNLSPKLENAVTGVSADEKLKTKCVTPAQFLKGASLKGAVIFIKIDVDELEDIATEYKIEAMPTFHFIKGGEWKKENMIKGANLAAILETVCKLIEFGLED